VTATDVDRAEAEHAPYLRLEVVRAVVEVCAHRSLDLVEALEQKLQRRPGVVVPLARELGGR
jgi:hypothetical protein